MPYLLCFALFLPLVSSLALIASSYMIGRKEAGRLASATILLSFLIFVVLLVGGAYPLNLTLFDWIPVRNIEAGFTLHLDSLSLLMSLIITGVGALIHIYSIGYIEHEEDFARYFACLNLFVFAMLLLVLAGHLLVLFLGWEGVGLASYLLIGYWYQRPAAAAAATKAFIVNRIGDLGLLIGLLLTFQLFGTGDMGEISSRAGQLLPIGSSLATLLTLLYFIGAVGKSAQLPLHTWLPDAMEGPTPVSALIHAATMVTAGVYLVVRMHPLFLLAPETMHLIAIIGAATSLFAACCALGQTDLKRVLAYSTVSQLGLMFLACGVGAFYAAMFHLTAHAFVKALLFLSAGNVVHMLHGSTEMEKMGGLSKDFPTTHWLFLIGVLAMSGIPPLAAFFSKDLILEEVSQAGFTTLFLIGLATSTLTAFYLTRAYCLTFTGKPHPGEAHEAPPVMLRPVAVLGFLSLTGGLLGFSFGQSAWLEHFLSQVGLSMPGEEAGFQLFLRPATWLAIGGALLGVGGAALLYTRFSDRLKGPSPLLKNAFFIDTIYSKGIVLPLKGLAQLIAKEIEPKMMDGSVRAVVFAAEQTGRAGQRLQSGQIRSYIAWMTAGIVLLTLYLVL